MSDKVWMITTGSITGELDRTGSSTAMPMEFRDPFGDEATRLECERLVKLNAELLEALERIADMSESELLDCVPEVRKLIAKAKGE